MVEPSSSRLLLLLILPLALIFIFLSSISFYLAIALAPMQILRFALQGLLLEGLEQIHCPREGRVRLVLHRRVKVVGITASIWITKRNKEEAQTCQSCPPPTTSPVMSRITWRVLRPSSSLNFAAVLRFGSSQLLMSRRSQEPKPKYSRHKRITNRTCFRLIVCAEQRSLVSILIFSTSSRKVPWIHGASTKEASLPQAQSQQAPCRMQG